MHTLKADNHGAPHHQNIVLASIDEIRAHYQCLAEITLEYQRGSCVGLTAVCLFLGHEILQQDVYSDIEIQMCQLANWRHMFIKISHCYESYNLFYDPWYQYWQDNHLDDPFLIPERSFSNKMEQIVSSFSRNNLKPIQHIKFLAEYNSFTRRINSTCFNIQTDYSYYVICSSASFKNPAKQIDDSVEPVEKINPCIIHLTSKHQWSLTPLICL